MSNTPRPFIIVVHLQLFKTGTKTNQNNNDIKETRRQQKKKFARSLRPTLRTEYLVDSNHHIYYAPEIELRVFNHLNKWKDPKNK